jgi:hypothetical protein
MPAMTSVVAAAHHRNGKIGGRAAEHVGQDDDAMAIVGTGNRFENILPPLIHVVLGADADRLDEFLRTDDMLDRMTKLFSQLAMRDKHKSDHDTTAPTAYANYKVGQISQCSNFVHRWGPSWQ